MRWYKIEFFTSGTRIENRIRVVERQYSSSVKARMAADRMMCTMQRKHVECFAYTVKPM